MTEAGTWAPFQSKLTLTRQELSHLVNSELLTDREIAARFRVGTTTVRKWRLKLKIPQANKQKRFVRKFNLLYGDKGGTRQFRSLYMHNQSLKYIAQHFGFTPRYASLTVAALGLRGRGSGPRPLKVRGFTFPEEEGT